MNHDEWDEIRRSHAGGESIKGIARRLGISRNTVRRALSMETAPADHRRTRGGAGDAFDSRIRDLLQQEPDITIAEIGRRIEWDRSRTLLSRQVALARADVQGSPAGADATGTGLPQPPTSFVGRDQELRELRGLLGDNRLVSIVGPGGIGKTRLAIHAASEFRRAYSDGVRFVDLSSLRSESLIAQAICDRLGLETRGGAATSAEELLLDHLRTRQMLLVLDNCEHLIDGAADVMSVLIEQTSSVRVLATSREYLSIPGERVFALPPLPTGADATFGALELFQLRAAGVRGGFTLTDHNIDAARRICHRLDGVPLAIELACTRLNVMSVEELAEMLERRIDLSSGGSRGRAERHQSLQATIDWSFDLCSPSEQRLWCRASVFADSFDLEMLVAVCAHDDDDDNAPTPAATREQVREDLAGLVAKSIVTRKTVDGESRFRFLETIRAYGWSKSTDAQRVELNRRLLTYCARIVVESNSQWYGPGQSEKAQRVSVNRGNIRAALQSAMTTPDDPGLVDLVLDTLGDARYLWAYGVSMHEHRMWLTRALEMTGGDRQRRRKVLAVLAMVQTLQGDRAAADYTLLRAAELTDSGDRSETAAFILHISGLRDFFAGQSERATSQLDEAERRYRELGVGPDLMAMLMVHRGMNLCSVGDLDAAEFAFQRVMDRTRQDGDQWFRSYAGYGLGHVAHMRADHAAAEKLARDALRNHRQFGDTLGKTVMADVLGWALASQGEGEQAAYVLGATSAIWGAIGQQLYGAAHWNKLHDEAVNTARAQIGAARFDAAWEKGRVLGVDSLLDFVFDEQPPAAARSGAPAGRATALESLSAREAEVAELVADGLTNKEIAELLVLSPRTIEGHVDRVLRKLGLSRRTQVGRVLSA